MGVLGTERRRRRRRRRGRGPRSAPRTNSCSTKHFKRRGRPWMPQQRDHAAQSASPLRAATAVHPSVRPLVRPSARPPARPPSARSSRPAAKIQKDHSPLAGPGCRSSNGTTPLSPHPRPAQRPQCTRPSVRSSARPPVRPLVRRPPVRLVPRQNIQKDHFKRRGRPWMPQQRDHAAQSASPLRAATAVHPSVRQLVRPSARPPARPLRRRSAPTTTALWDYRPVPSTSKRKLGAMQKPHVGAGHGSR